MTDRERLELLSKSLATPGLPSQQAMAKAANVDQPLVSRARNDELKRVTQRVERLEDYVNMRLASLSASAADGADGGAAKRDRNMARSMALAECSQYLDDGYDVEILQQQIAILRRAQHPRSGRPAKAFLPI